MPEGLILNSESCSISGIPYGIKDNMTVKIKSNFPKETLGSFLISVRDCDMHAFEILRTYGSSNVYFELFSVVDADSGQVLINVTSSTPKKGGQAVSYRFCSISRSLKITLGSTVYDNWYTGSKLEVFGLGADSSKDLLLGCRMDTLAGLPTEYWVDVGYSISRDSIWFYWMNSLPENWQASTATEHWNFSHADAFPRSSNQIQLYKKLFYLTDLQSGSYEMALRYQSGCAVFINGVEVFRDQLPADQPITEATVATGSYAEPAYRSVLLPASVWTGAKWKPLFEEGGNLVTVALLHTEAAEFDGHFDLSLRFAGAGSQFRGFAMESAVRGLEGPRDALVDGDHETWVRCDHCSEEAEVVLSFKSAARREVISRVELVGYFHDVVPGPSGFLVSGRARSDAPWDKLNVIQDVEWTEKAQRVRFWIHESQPLHELRFSNLQTSDTMILSEVLLYGEQLTREVPPFQYENRTLYADTALGVAAPASHDYYNFAVAPPLPDGLHLNVLSGDISGTPSVVITQLYTISARRFDGCAVQTVFALSVLPCASGRAAYRLILHIDQGITASWWALYAGQTAEGEPLERHAIDRHAAHTERHSFCLPDGFYTLFFVETSGSGWNVPAGFSLTTQQEHFVVATGALPRTFPQPVSNQTLVFQAHQPIQPRTSLWHVCADCELTEDWTDLNFDDFQWTEMFTDGLAELEHESPTIYLRRRFVLEDMNNYDLMRLQIRFVGGVVIYFNGNPVYRLNLDEDPSPSDYAWADHDGSAFTQFSIPLRAMFAKDGENVLALELHVAQDSLQPVDFDCVAVLDISEASPLSTSYAAFNGTAAMEGRVENLFDMDLSTAYRAPFQPGTFWEWEFENLHRTVFNEYWIVGANRIQNFTWRLQGRFGAAEDWIEIDRQSNASLLDREPRRFAVPAATSGFRSLRFEVLGDVSVSVFELLEFFLVYRSPEGHNFCPSLDGYFAAANASLSFAPCPYGYFGLASRFCLDREWEPEDLSECRLMPPSHLVFPVSTLRIPTGNVLHPLRSNVTGLVSAYSASPALPSGLFLSTKGKLLGRANATTAAQLYTITARNDAGSTSFVMEIEVYDRWCEATATCPRMKVGEVCSFACQKAIANTLGKAFKRCEAEDDFTGKWGAVYGRCVSQALVIAIISLGVSAVLLLFVQIVEAIVKRRSINAHRNK